MPWVRAAHERSYELTARLLEHETKLEAKLEQQQVEMEKLRAAAVEANMQVLRAETEAKVQAAEAKAELSNAQLCEQQLVVLRARLERLLASKLLEEDLAFAIEDIIADSAPGADSVKALVSLSTGMVSDAGFARQLIRKYSA